MFYMVPDYITNVTVITKCVFFFLSTSEIESGLNNQWGPWMSEIQKGVLKDDKVIVEKLNKFFASVFTAEDVREIPKPEPAFVGDI